MGVASSGSTGPGRSSGSTSPTGSLGTASIGNTQSGTSSGFSASTGGWVESTGTTCSFTQVLGTTATTGGGFSGGTFANAAGNAGPAGDAAAAGAATGMGGTTGGGVVACRFQGANVNFQAETCSPGGTATCVNDNCICMSADGRFQAAFTDAGVAGDCQSALNDLCTAAATSTASASTTGSSASSGGSTAGTGGSTGTGWSYQSSTGCSFIGGTNEGVGGAGMTGVSGSTGSTGSVSCQWTTLTANPSTETCTTSPTVTCVDSNCICFDIDGGFLSAFTDGVSGDCQGNLTRCP